ncbi:MAG TPA: GtrA family protein, partial [Polyangiaceae bacterium]|nr:GtrA family protein [Polyangiaceae bacterium]
LVSYVRARAEGLGADARVGLMQRPERVVVLGVAMALSPIVDRFVTIAAPPFVLSVAAVCFVALTTHATALYRLHHLLRQLGSQSFGFGSHLIGVVISSALATAVDFGVMVALVEYGRIVPWLATGVAALAGASVNFSINRLLVFESDDPAAPQAFRYSVVSATGALLNAGGVGAVLLQPDLDYRAGWLVVRAAVFLLWSYTLQRSYVYRPAVRPVATSDPAELVLRNVERARD